MQNLDKFGHFGYFKVPLKHSASTLVRKVPMPKIKIAQSHALSREDLEKRVDDYLIKLRDDKMKMVDFDFKWKDDKQGVDLTGKGFKGFVKVADNEVEIKVDLSLMLSPFKGKVEDGLKRGIVKYLS